MKKYKKKTTNITVKKEKFQTRKKGT